MKVGKKKPAIGSLLIQGAQEAIAHKRGILVAEITLAKATARHVDVVPPPEFGTERIQALRARLGVSQTVFAELLGTSPSTVRAWEQGVRIPRPSTRRLLEIADRHPEVFKADLRQVE